MTFRDDRERDAWERTYDSGIRATVGFTDAIIYADAKVRAMREREAKPQPEAPVRGERERLHELARAIRLNDAISVETWRVVWAEFDKALAALPPDEVKP